jgi:hypothetical protein
MQKGTPFVRAKFFWLTGLLRAASGHPLLPHSGLLALGQANYLPALIKRGLGHLAVSGGNQTFGDQ